MLTQANDNLTILKCVLTISKGQKCDASNTRRQTQLLCQKVQRRYKEDINLTNQNVLTLILVYMSAGTWLTVVASNDMR